MTEAELAELYRHVHDARKPLNRISMQAELVKMALNDEIPKEKAVDALDRIIACSKECSASLSGMVEAMGERPDH